MNLNSELISGLTVSPDLPILATIEALTRASRKILLVADSEGKLRGTVTDYDIRKAILEHIDFSRPVRDIMAIDPVTASAGTDETAIMAIMERRRVHQLPLLDGAGKAVGIRFIEEFVHLHPRDDERVAVVMAGGLGTRLQPATAHTPKPLLSVGGRPILFILLDQILNEGFSRIYISVNYKSEMIINSIRTISRYQDSVVFVTEQKPMGTAGSLTLLPERPRRPFVVINADLLMNVALSELLRFHRVEANAATVAIKRETYVVPYGVAEISGTRITGLREKPEFSYFLNTGVYALEPDALDDVPADTFLDMTDLVRKLLETGRRVGNFPVHEYWLDIGTPDRYERAQAEYQARFVEKP